MRYCTDGVRLCLLSFAVLLGPVTGVLADDQDPVRLTTDSAATSQNPTSHHHDMQEPADAGSWMLMQDGILFGVYNHQGSARGGDELIAPNWWMGMASRSVGRSQVTFSAMVSLDPATVGNDGYREIFQVGEALDGRPLIDRQHPHDLFMQLAGVWRLAVTERTGFTLSGGPAGEPALGPVAFMHRASAADNAFAPLGHHTFDSTHIAYGVVTAAVDRGPFVLEGSVFNGREPDQHRWDFDFGRLDSVSARLWYKPAAAWELQVSTGHLRDPEELSPGDITRTTASAGFMTVNGTDFTAATVAYGVNATDHGTRHAMFVEAARKRGGLSVSGRVELLQLESETLLHGIDSDHHDDAVPKTPLAALTAGAVREVLEWRGFEGGLGANVTFYAVPGSLQATYGRHPVSFQLFFRVRPPAPMGRMWNMRMSQPIAGHRM